MMGPLFADDDFQFGLENALGAVYRQAADVGEVLATAGRIQDGDADSWVQEWTATAGAARAMAAQAAERGHRVSALTHYLRAATYYATALYRIAYSSEPERRQELWRRQRDCWDHAVDRFAIPGERRTCRTNGVCTEPHKKKIALETVCQAEIRVGGQQGVHAFIHIGAIGQITVNGMIKSGRRPLRHGRQRQRATILEHHSLRLG